MNDLTSQSVRTTSLNQVDWDFVNSAKSRDINSIHPYPAKFIPELPRTLIESLGVPENSWVLDPFCGSGVTLVEAQMAGIPSVGVDLNPIACLISRVKTQPLNSPLMPFLETVFKITSDFGVSQTHLDIPNLGHWFREDISNRLSQMFQAVNTVDAPPEIRDALQLALSSIIVRVSRQESDTRYAAIEKNTKVTDVDRLFELSCKQLSEQLSLRSAMQPKARIIEADVTKVGKLEIGVPVGLVVTSPPYPAAYEYWLYHKYRMYWLGHDPVAVREREIGARPHYFRKEPATPNDFKLQMKQVAHLVYETMVVGGHYCVVVGSSKIHGIIVDNAALISDASEEIGFKKIHHIERNIASGRKSFNLKHARLKTESILVFQKSKDRSV